MRDPPTSEAMGNDDDAVSSSSFLVAVFALTGQRVRHDHAAGDAAAPHTRLQMILRLEHASLSFTVIRSSET